MVKSSFGGEYRDPEARKPTTTGLRKTGKTEPESHEPAPTTNWLVVIPVKGTPDAKSRFGDGDHTALALAVALDTVEAALAAPGVTGVVVVTSPEAATAFDQTEALVMLEDVPSGLRGAIELGIETASALGAAGRGTAVLLGDLPALTPAELSAALAAAAEHQLAFVPDAEGTGTALITAADGAVHAPAFGSHSAALHAAAGYVELELPTTSGLRNDVDTLERLEQLGDRLGTHTREALR